MFSNKISESKVVNTTTLCTLYVGMICLALTVCACIPHYMVLGYYQLPLLYTNFYLNLFDIFFCNN